MAILIAVLIVALVTAGNDYSKELQFRALEKTSEEGNRSMVLRDGVSQLVREGGRAEGEREREGGGVCVRECACCIQLVLFCFVWKLVVSGYEKEEPLHQEEKGGRDWRVCLGNMSCQDMKGRTSAPRTGLRGELPVSCICILQVSTASPQVLPLSWKSIPLACRGCESEARVILLTVSEERAKEKELAPPMPWLLRRFEHTSKHACLVERG